MFTIEMSIAHSMPGKNVEFSRTKFDVDVESFFFLFFFSSFKFNERVTRRLFFHYFRAFLRLRWHEWTCWFLASLQYSITRQLMRKCSFVSVYLSLSVSPPLSSSLPRLPKMDFFFSIVTRPKLEKSGQVLTFYCFCHLTRTSKYTNHYFY